MKFSDSKNKLTCFVIMTLFHFIRTSYNFQADHGALLAKFQPGVLNPFALICGCLLYICLCFSSPILRKIYLTDCFSHSREFLDTANNKEGGLTTN